MDSPIAQVACILRRITGRRQIEPTDRLFHDLGLSGDDASEMLDEVASTFGITFSGFEFARYFPQEDEALGAHIARLMKLKLRREPLTVQHLAVVAQRRAWFNPPPSV